jgi:ornithine carbamoyltransferase
MAARHVLSIADLDTEALSGLVDDGVAIARGEWEWQKPLAGKTVGIYFKKSSTRTRTSFSVGAMKLGASIISYGPNDLQIVTGETLRDTARVLASYLDALVIRTNEPIAEMRALANQERMSIVNAMSDNEHPTQVVADLVAMKEAFGHLEDLHVLYIGEGNNTTTALALAFGLLPRMRLTIVTPAGYGIPQEVIDQARDFAARSGGGSMIEQHHDMDALPQGVNVVYTTRWLTMGVQRADPEWLPKFRPYTITPEVMSRVSGPGTLFMHDLPAMRGYEVVDEVLDGPQSIAFRQAYHKMTSAMAVLNWCVAGA